MVFLASIPFSRQIIVSCGCYLCLSYMNVIFASLAICKLPENWIKVSRFFWPLIAASRSALPFFFLLCVVSDLGWEFNWPVFWASQTLAGWSPSARMTTQPSSIFFCFCLSFFSVFIIFCFSFLFFFISWF